VVAVAAVVHGIVAHGDPYTKWTEIHINGITADEGQTQPSRSPCRTGQGGDAGFILAARLISTGTLPPPVFRTTRKRFVALASRLVSALPGGPALTVVDAVRSPFLVYRDRIGTPSEIGFLRRQYIGFDRLEPIWIGRTILPQAGQISDRIVRLGGTAPWGGLRRLLFRHCHLMPPVALPPLAPVLHAQFARGGALALPLARFLGLNLVVTLHGGDVGKNRNWQGTVLARRWPAVVAEAKVFICVAAAVADLASWHGVPAAKLIVLPIGVEVPATLPTPPRAPTCHLFVGRFVEKKGIGILADAVRRLRASGDQTPVVCVGDGTLRPVLQDLAREVPGVELTGWVSQAEVGRLMGTAWTLLVPSVVAADGDAEGLPSVVPEAMAQGCPVIGSAEGGIAEAVTDGVSGLLVPPGNPVALAAAMRRLTADVPLRHRLGQGAFAAVGRTLNARVQSAALQDVLLRAAQAPRL
jgi:colanic acid/amylovoran biosynthesis glycosyltransferase